MINRGLITEESEVSGIDKEINAYLPSYGKMYGVFGERLREEAVQEIAEKIIYYGTIYGDAKPMFRKKLNQYVSGGWMTESEAKRISGYKFKDWARLSRSMLCLSGCDKSTGEKISLIRAMWEYNLNFMELIYSEDFTFQKELEERRKALGKNLQEFQFEDLDEYYYSAPVKRMIWQAVQSLKEITQIMGHNPKRIFIEKKKENREERIQEKNVC